ALTGHLVLSTLHTNDAPSAVTRLIDIGVQPFLIGATLLGVVAQRLVRILCPHCKQDGPLPEAAWRSLLGPQRSVLPPRYLVPVGCDECRHTGFRGRQGIYEVMRTNSALAELIDGELQTATLRRAALRQGMRPLRVAGAQKVARGLTTVEEVIKVVPLAEA
ncbi:MAG: ATPase, T2SS/T4P/T4SS family, partial [Gammaproteobacteria bacterium]